jgi:hypothetical protein
MCIVVVERITLAVRGKPTVCKRRKAAVLGTVWQVPRTPPGSESGACLHRGNSGTWESHPSPCTSAGKGGPADQRPWRGPGASTGRRAGNGDHERGKPARYRGRERQAKHPERDRVAVVAAHSTEDGGEVRPKRPTGGKAPSGRASAGRRQGRDFELTNPDHGTPGDCDARWVLAWAAEALLEEPYALIAHVRVCGGAGWVTTGSTQQPTAYSVRSFVAPASSGG